MRNKNYFFVWIARIFFLMYGFFSKTFGQPVALKNTYSFKQTLLKSKIHQNAILMFCSFMIFKPVNEKKLTN